MGTALFNGFSMLLLWCNSKGSWLRPPCANLELLGRYLWCFINLSPLSKTHLHIEVGSQTCSLGLYIINYHKLIWCLSIRQTANPSSATSLAPSSLFCSQASRPSFCTPWDWTHLTYPQIWSCDVQIFAFNFFNKMYILGNSKVWIWSFLVILQQTLY